MSQVRVTGDCGVSFAGPDQPGIDLIMPDVSFMETQRKRLHGIVLTHAHEDHFGALIHLWPKLRVPIYATPFSAALRNRWRRLSPSMSSITRNGMPSWMPKSNTWQIAG